MNMRWTRDYTQQKEERTLYRQAMIITITGNILLAIAKAIGAYLTGSVSLYADAANSASDVLYSLLMVLGLWVAQQPPDLSHPQGHSRFEPLVGLMVTLSMLYAGFEAGRTAIVRFLAGGEAIALGLPTLVLLFSAAMKAGMFIWIRNLAVKLHSPTLKVTAQDNLSDVLTSTAAFFGVLGSTYIHPLLDPIGGIVVALWIFRAVYNAGKENLHFLTGGGATQEQREELVKLVEEIPGVIRVHHLMTDYVGPKMVVDMHVNMDGNKTLYEAHAISDQIIKKLESLPEVDRAYVHIEPHDWVD
jgi:cation diffusion facilitator family transporter